MAKKATATLDARAERISKICANINKGDWGGESHDAVTYLGSRDAISIQRWSSGCPQLDDALGGGWPKGRFIEVFGPEMSGKTTAVLHAIAEHQKKYPDEDVGLIDSEYTFDEEYAQTIGVDTKYLIVHQPEHGKQALNVLEELIQAGVMLCVVDSVAALTTKEEIEGDIGDLTVGAQARMMSSALRRLTVEAGRRQATVIWTNQLRDKIGVMWGDKTTTPAGRALKHYASIRARFDRIGNIKDGETIVSSKTKADIKKNKVAPPFRRAEFCITFGIGIDTVAAILDDAISFKVIKKRGSWLSFEDEQLGQGRAAVLAMLRGDCVQLAAIKKATEDFKEKLVEGKVAAPTPDADDEEVSGIKRPKAGRTPVSDPDAIDASDDDTVEVGDA